MTVEELLWSQGRRKDWLARQMMIHPSHLSRMLSGERAWTTRMKVRAATALGVKVEDVFFGVDAREVEQNVVDMQAS